MIRSQVRHSSVRLQLHAEVDTCAEENRTDAMADCYTCGGYFCSSCDGCNHADLCTDACAVRAKLMCLPQVKTPRAMSSQGVSPAYPPRAADSCTSDTQPLARQPKEHRHGRFAVTKSIALGDI